MKFSFGLYTLKNGYLWQPIFLSFGLGICSENSEWTIGLDHQGLVVSEAPAMVVPWWGWCRERTQYQQQNHRTRYWVPAGNSSTKQCHCTVKSFLDYILSKIATSGSQCFCPLDLNHQRTCQDWYQFNEILFLSLGKQDIQIAIWGRVLLGLLFYLVNLPFE